MGRSARKPKGTTVLSSAKTETSLPPHAESVALEFIRAFNEIFDSVSDPAERKKLYAKRMQEILKTTTGRGL